MVKKFGEYGQVTYKKPNIPQAMRLLGELGVLDADNMTQKDELLYVAKMIERMGEFITKIEIKFDGKTLKKYDDLIEHFEFMPYLSELASELFSSMNVSEDKKKQSGTLSIS